MNNKNSRKNLNKVPKSLNIKGVGEESMYYFVFDETNIGICFISFDFNLFQSNDSFHKLLGYTQNELAAISLENLIHQEDLDKSFLHAKNLISGLIPNYVLEKRYIKKNKEIFWAKVNGSLLYDKNHLPVGIIEILEDITEKKNIEKSNHDLKNARELAEAANRSKSDFLANMSHEIRTPINAIIGLNYLMQKTELLPKQKDYVEKTIISAKGLLSIVNDILDFSKIEANKIVLESVDFDLYEILNNISNIISFKAFEKGLKLHFIIDPEVPQMLKGDSFRLNQILLNLTNNAIKFTEYGEISITVTLAYQDSEQISLKFIVNDTGIGMEEEQQSRLFKAFSQADMSTTRKYGGSGLGLVISKNLIEIMGGSISVKSELNKGSTFTFTAIFDRCSDSFKNESTTSDFNFFKVLLITSNQEMRIILKEQLEFLGFSVSIVTSGMQAMETIYEKGRYDLILIDWETKGTLGIQVTEQIRKEFLIFSPKIMLVSAYRENELQKAADASNIDGVLYYPISKTQLRNKIEIVFASSISRDARGTPNFEGEKFHILSHSRILLVEDNAINQQVAKEILEDSGLIVDLAGNGRDAVQLVKSRQYDAVLMDLQMPVMDGYEATKAIRNLENGKEIPIIAMTADAMKGVKTLAFEAGMNDFIIKPIDPIQLFNILKLWIHTLKELKENQGKDTSIHFKNTTLELPDTLPGLNLSDGILRMMGNKESYVKILFKFSEKHTIILEEIKNALKNGEYDTATMIAHTLKGVAANIGANDLQSSAMELQAAIKAEKNHTLQGLLICADIKLSEVLESIDYIRHLQKNNQ